jgi:predicted kinase
MGKRMNMMILIGLPGAGKSTYASDFKDYEVVNQDLLGNRQKCIKKTKELLSEGKNVIIDRTNINRKQRAIWTNIAKEHGVVDICFVELRIEPELAFKRIKQRKNHPSIKDGTSDEKIREIIGRFVTEYEEPHANEDYTSYTVFYPYNFSF